jgi:hypothetical protein
MGKSGVVVVAGMGTGSGRCGNGWKAVAAAEVGVPLTDICTMLYSAFLDNQCHSFHFVYRLHSFSAFSSLHYARL